MSGIKQKKIGFKIGRIENLEILLIFPTLLFILAFVFDNPNNIFHGLYSIIISPDILLTDYLKIGGLGATFVNTSLLAFFNIFIIYKLQLKINGALIAATYTIIGFSFFGKNIFNVWPMYIGGYLYIKYHQIEFKNILVVVMFSTALAPAVSELSFALNLPIYIGVPLGVLFGIICGYIITPLSSNMSRVHDGYNLYNIGFTAGIIGIVLNSILRSFGINIPQQQILSAEYDTLLKILLFLFFIMLIIIGYVINNKSFKGYNKIFNFSGRLVTDFTQLVGYGLTFINMGIMGLIAMSFVFLAGGDGVFNGPVVGGIFTVVGFAALGKHPKNTIPIMIGVFLAGILKIWNMQSTPVIIAGLFGTTLAPITGKYGFSAGIIAGFLHLSVAMNVGTSHGGINLYNNGFSGGLVAAFLFSLFDTLRKGD